ANCRHGCRPWAFCNEYRGRDRASLRGLPRRAYGPDCSAQLSRGGGGWLHILMTFGSGEFYMYEFRCKSKRNRYALTNDRTGQSLPRGKVCSEWTFVE